MPQKYIRITEAAEIWSISPRQVQNLCRSGSVPGAVRFGRSWMIPVGTPKPIDGRTRRAKEEKAQEATNSHTYTWDKTGEIWEKIRPVRNWSELEKSWSEANDGE